MAERAKQDWRTWSVMLALIAALAVGATGGTFGGALIAADQERPVTEQEAREGLSHAQNLSTAFRAAAQATKPSVVTLNTRMKQDVSGAIRGFRGNPFQGTPHEEFFKRFGFDLPEGMDVDIEDLPPQVRSGTGSGVIIDREGLILTNNHVVAGADEVVVKLLDGREFVATDIRTDPETDLALLRIEGADDLPAAKLGDSDRLSIGDWVIAIGNPFDLESTVSAGIISGKGRDLGKIRRAKFLQTDAAINPGNSGGPLVNLRGEVIGINTAIASSSGGYQGIGFAVPVNLAKWVIAQLQENGEVRRAYLGVAIGEVNAEIAEQLDVDLRSGVVVGQVYPDTPAAAAGLQENDVIVRFDDQQVRAPGDLQQIVERSTVGETLQVEVVRAGEKQTLDIQLEKLPADFGNPRLAPRKSAN
ncbi:MAG: trypsin-like peptidase domain-containing protein [Pirellulales bacterium]